MLLNPRENLRIIALLAALVAFGPMSIDMYLPSLPTIAEDLQTSAESIQLTITLFLVGFCLGTMFYGPISDQYGRRPVLISGIIIYTLTSIACTLVDSAEQLIWLRFFQAIGGAAASVLARTIVRDIFDPKDTAQILSLMHIITMIAPLLAPILGGYILIWFGWRTVFFSLAVFGAICLAIVLLYLNETYPKENRSSTSLTSAFANYGRIFSNKQGLGLVLTGALSFAGMFAYITGSPFVFIEYLNISPVSYSYLFALNILGIIIFATINTRIVKRVGVKKMLAYGSRIAAISGSLLLVANLLNIDGLITIFVPLFFYISVIGFVGANCIAELLRLFSSSAGVATATFTMSMFGLGFISSMAVGFFHDGTPFAMSLIVFISGIGSFLSFYLTQQMMTIKKK